MSVSVCRDARRHRGSPLRRGIAIYFTKRKLPRARRIAPFPRDKRAARWLKCFKENRSSRLSISFEESCKSILTAGRASYWTKNSNSSISVRERKGEYGDASYSVCIHCAFSVLLTGTNPGCQSNLLFYVPSVSLGLLRRPTPLLTLS